MRPSRRLLAQATLALAAAACTPAARHTATDPAPMNAIAESYVQLVLAVGAHDADYVDAYYGPPEWKSAADSSKAPLDALHARADSLLAALDALRPDAGWEELVRLRHDYLRAQLGALRARVEMLQGRTLSFDEESRALYDAVAPTHDEAYFRGALDRLAHELPGTGSVPERYTRWRAAFIIPPAKVDTVFSAAITACRERTARHLTLPPDESFRVEYVTGKPWSGYNWYQGHYRSLIQVNTDLPIFIDRALDLACHEGYPGHHVYNALLEQALVRERGWVEFSVYPLFSPQSLIAEGSANYGIEMAFPGATRAAFERETLFPLAGLDPARAEEYYRVQGLVRELGYAGNEAARRYLNGEISREAAADWLVRYALMTPAAAAQRTRFFDRYRSYVINYNLGQDLVRAYVERTAATDADDARWRVFGALLSSPRLPSGLQTAR